MRWLLMCLMFATGASSALTLQAPTAHAQASQIQTSQIQTSPAQTSPAKASRAHRTLQQRFDDANVTHDGRLTAEQARSGMPAVSRDFATIDAGNRGYVTLEDIKAASRERRAARRAGKAAMGIPK